MQAQLRKLTIQFRPKSPPALKRKRPLVQTITMVDLVDMDTEPYGHHLTIHMEIAYIILQGAHILPADIHMEIGIILHHHHLTADILPAADIHMRMGEESCKRQPLPSQVFFQGVG